MKKIRLLSLLLLACSLTLLPVHAEEWHPSKTNTVISVPDDSSVVYMGNIPMIITTDQSYQTKEDPAVIVSSVSDAINEYTRTVYQYALQYSGRSTDEYLSSYNGLKDKIQSEAVRLMGRSASSNRFRIHSLFDVWANTEAKKLINEQGCVNISVSLNGISKSGAYMAVHFPADGSDPVILPCTWEDGVLNITLGTEFSTVMILSYETRKADPDTSIQGNSEHTVFYYLPVILIPCIYLFTRKKSSD